VLRAAGTNSISVNCCKPSFTRVCRKQCCKREVITNNCPAFTSSLHSQMQLRVSEVLRDVACGTAHGKHSGRKVRLVTAIQQSFFLSIVCDCKYTTFLVVHVHRGETVVEQTCSSVRTRLAYGDCGRCSIHCALLYYQRSCLETTVCIQCAACTAKVAIHHGCINFTLSRLTEYIQWTWLPDLRYNILDSFCKLYRSILRFCKLYRSILAL
jgi:hypothetical protein